ncbi:efflux RND transporter permease subunit [Blastopirellula sp. JC732]|uniref:Efflux RND transporter permease subunit n=1 Tax=Blastopirellula sediminis TaxID=2894196 RepID=A0A9X1MPC6_9BACT|nr:efflux RND transporter permease subunit [Blastopirellula sediminis]MCC9606246.1 efflux RND transporter permease subunit [Blastopirellula sediminis]MCC9630456.1 efflux RND transporter permease subunit [Blastopirellula sediminis]
MNYLPEFAIKRPTVVVSIVLMTVIWGIVSFMTMPRREDPEFTIKVCVVATQWSGASAQKVEELITDPLEEAIDGLEEVKLIRSTSSNGLSTIFVELEDSLPSSKVDDIWDKVRARVRNVQMPEPNIEPFVNDEFTDTNIILFAVHQKPLDGATEIDPAYAYTPRDLDIYSEQIRDELRLLPGVAKVDRFGVLDEAIYIETDAGTWSKLGLTSTQLMQLVAARNIVAPGGTIDADDGRFYVKPGGEFDAVQELDSIIAALSPTDSAANHVYLDSLGMSVRRDYIDPPPRICRYGDTELEQTAVVVAVTMKSGSNIIDICDSAKAKVDQMQNVAGLLPPDLGVTIISDQSDSVKGRIRDVIVNIIEAILIVIVVVYLVVGFRTAAVMAANIPFVVLSSIGVITLFNVQLEQMSLASMIIALGLLVDNAVQICDQARTNQMAGMSPVEAAVSGAQMLGASMLNGTLTTIAAFVPMLIALDGANREFIYGLPITLSVMLGISWILAMTFCVILAAAFIRAPKDLNNPTAPIPWLMAWCAKRFRKGGKPHSEGHGFIYETYAWLGRFALRYKFATIGLSVLVLILAMRLPVGSEFFPLTERDQFVVEVWLPEIATIEQTDAVAKQVEGMIRKLSPYVDDEGNERQRLAAMRTLVGGGGSRWYLSWEPEPRKPNYAEILVHTTDGKRTHEFAEKLRAVAREGDESLGLQPIAGARVVPIEMFLGPPADPVVMRVVGDGFADMNRLHAAADRVKAMVEAQPETWDVNDSWGVEGYQLRVNVDPDKASLSQVGNSQIAETLNAYYSGRLLTTFREGDHQVPVYFRLQPEGRRSIADIESAYVEGDIGKVPLSAVASVAATWEPAIIDRRDMNRTIEVRSRVEPGASGNDITMRVMNSPEMQELQAHLPPGFRVEIGGAMEESLKAQGKMLKSFGLSFVVIILLLIVQFNSLSKMLVIVATLPLAMIGSIFGLWVTSNPLGFMPQLGVLSLFGIVLNAGIIYMEFADIVLRERAEKGNGDGPILGLTKPEFRAALVEAGRQRLMPIFLTTATTVGGLFPLALAGGPLWEGMAWLMIYGLMVATLLTLFVIPALYAVVIETFGVRPFSIKGTPSPSE